MVAFSYHAKAQAEFDLILDAGGAQLRRCLALAVARHDLIADGVAPLSPLEGIGPGQASSALFKVEYSIGLQYWLAIFYEQIGNEVVVLAIDAWARHVAFGRREGGDGYQRSMARSR